MYGRYKLANSFPAIHNEICYFENIKEFLYFSPYINCSVSELRIIILKQKEKRSVFEVREELIRNLPSRLPLCALLPLKLSFSERTTLSSSSQPAALEVSTSYSLEALCSGESGVSALEESNDSVLDRGFPFPFSRRAC